MDDGETVVVSFPFERTPLESTTRDEREERQSLLPGTPRLRTQSDAFAERTAEQSMLFADFSCGVKLNRRFAYAFIKFCSQFTNEYT